jgi:16S rRNA (uracil1498-N3)-methyltransferase
VGHVPHLLLPGPWIEAALPLPSSADHHLRKVLRLADGHPVTYTDGQGNGGTGVLTLSGVERGSESSVPAPRIELTLAVAPPHDKDRVRFLVEKLAELEVRRLHWLRTQFGTHRLPDSSKANSWARAALEQSHGSWLMKVEDGWSHTTDLGADAWFADVGAETPATPFPSVLTVAIGPEGGWETGEIPDGAVRFGLGRTVLRVETAGLVAAARFLV